MLGEDRDARSQERGDPAKVGEDDLDVGEATLLARDDEVGSGLERLVGYLELRENPGQRDPLEIASYLTAHFGYRDAQVRVWVGCG